MKRITSLILLLSFVFTLYVKANNVVVEEFPKEFVTVGYPYRYIIHSSKGYGNERYIYISTKKPMVGRKLNNGDFVLGVLDGNNFSTLKHAYHKFTKDNSIENESVTQVIGSLLYNNQEIYSYEKRDILIAKKIIPPLFRLISKTGEETKTEMTKMGKIVVSGLLLAIAFRKGFRIFSTVLYKG
jgi:hypothetical protein